MNCSFIATQFAGLLKYPTSVVEIDKAGRSVFGFVKQKFPSDTMSSDQAQTIYDWVITLATQNIDNDKRNSLLRQFLISIIPKHRQHNIDSILEIANIKNKQADTVEGVEFDIRCYHSEINKHCRKLFIEGNFFHSVFEAAKIYNKKVQEKSQSQEDGSKLMMNVWTTNGVLKITACQTETDKNVQEGVKFLSAGLMQAMRNPQAHEPALDWPINKEDALDMLSFISYLFRKLDDSVYFKNNSNFNI